MARNGKIANLPSGIPDTLNSRIENSDPLMALVAWLNNLPEVLSILARMFRARPITEQNLSRRKQGGRRFLSFTGPPRHPIQPESNRNPT
jgi:hypothetical protein